MQATLLRASSPVVSQWLAPRRMTDLSRSSLGGSFSWRCSKKKERRRSAP
jgi:hypothetical protein